MKKTARHVDVEFVKDKSLGRLAPAIEETLYRITQEALTNIRKHSQTERVRVEIRRLEDDVHLEVRDWGVGFANHNGTHGSHGLKGMTERARIAGGRSRIESTVGEGTRVIVDLPYLARD